MTESPKWPSKVLVSNPHGFCAGVVRSIDGYRQAAADFKAAKELDPNLELYSIGQPAHNPDVISEFEGVMKFVKDITEVPQGGKALEGPHGTRIDNFQYALENNIELVPTMCPLVEAPQRRVIENTEKGIKTIYFGEPGHAEAIAVAGSGDAVLVEGKEEALETAQRLRAENPDLKLAFANQTTKNADEALEIQQALVDQFPDIQQIKKTDIC